MDGWMDGHSQEEQLYFFLLTVSSVKTKQWLRIRHVFSKKKNKKKKTRIRYVLHGENLNKEAYQRTATPSLPIFNICCLHGNHGCMRLTDTSLHSPVLIWNTGLYYCSPWLKRCRGMLRVPSSQLSHALGKKNKNKKFVLFECAPFSTVLTFWMHRFQKRSTLPVWQDDICRYPNRECASWWFAEDSEHFLGCIIFKYAWTVFCQLQQFKATPQ